MKEEIKQNERILQRIQNELAPLKKQEAEARRLWTLGYKKYVSATDALNARQKKGLTTDTVKNGVTNLTVKKLWDTIDGWSQKTEELTKRRDNARIAMEAKKMEIIRQEDLLSELMHEHKRQLEQTDGMVDKVFMLNDGVVAALQNMDKFLVSDVFLHLHEKATQKMIENSTSTRKVVIMTNSINIMDVGKVQEALAIIDAFTERVNPRESTRPKDELISILLDLLKEIIDVKIRVKAGPNLSKFLAWEVNDEQFPEIKKAQKLLASATNYVRSGKYVRLYTRENKDDVWQSVRQS
ncbi:MAG: hypothetical protein WCJ39_10295 [bacterium]